MAGLYRQSYLLPLFAAVQNCTVARLCCATARAGAAPERTRAASGSMMSGLPPKADMRRAFRYVRFVPLADISCSHGMSA